MNRQEIAEHVVKRLQDSINVLKTEYQTPNQIPSFVVNDLLPQELAKEIYRAFPKTQDMMLRDTLREQKYVSSQMNKHPSLLEEAVYAFQDARVVELIQKITGVQPMFPDEKLYAGGISFMEQNNFLNLHLDNSHDHDRKRYRVMNLLYYVTPDWKADSGGHLELWDHGVKSEPRVIYSQFNRLVVMATGQKSWHSVSPVKNEKAGRCCVSNYYFSPRSVEGKDYFHVTSFRGRPEQKARDCVLQFDNLVRMSLRKIFRLGIKKTTHIYRKEQ